MSVRLGATVLLSLILSACSLVPQTPIPTETLKPTVKPTITGSPATSTATFEPEDMRILTPSREPTYSMGTPIPDWEGLPIMPDANVGGPAGFGYVYSVNVTIDQAEEFYRKKWGGMVGR